MSPGAYRSLVAAVALLASLAVETGGSAIGVSDPVVGAATTAVGGAVSRATRDAGTTSPDEGAQSGSRYIIQLADPPLATYDGYLPELDATAPSVTTGAHRLQTETEAASRYLAHLAARQASFITWLGRAAPGVEISHRYRIAFNGVAARLNPSEAASARALPGVVRVTKEERVVPLMDASLPLIEAPSAWEDPRIGGRARAGRGIRIAFIDAGITAEHPFFDPGELRAPAGYPRSTLTVGNRTTDYRGAALARFTNEKVIVARSYASEEMAARLDPEDLTPLADGPTGAHGAHVAGIAAGSIVSAGPGSEGRGDLSLSGVAPGAYIMAYKMSYAYTPEILRIVDDAVADGADVINNSWGTAALNILDPEHHPLSQAFKAANQAGVVVVAAAGNAGRNGEATLGGPYQMLEEVITVGNVETGRSFRYLVGATGDGLPPELEQHPAVYWDLGAAFDTIEAPAYTGDLCSPSSANRSEGLVAIAPIDKVCPSGSFAIDLPPQLSYFAQVANAGEAGAAGVVLYDSAGEPVDAPAALRLLLLLPQLRDLTLPPTAMIAGGEAAALAQWAAAKPVELRMDSSATPVADPARTDRAHETTARGPAAGAHKPPKPDLAAPGTSILSAATTIDGEPNGYATASGTSMASPHVAGAAAVLRQAWPDWSTSQIKQALMVTADPVVATESGLASASVQGAGRLNLGRAIDPGLLIRPPSERIVSQHGRRYSNTLWLTDVRRRADAEIEYRVRFEPGGDGANLVATVPATVTLAPGETKSISYSIETASPEPGDYDGRIAFDSGAHVVRFLCQVHVPAPPKDVLLVNVLRNSGGGEDEEDYSGYWTAALDEAGLSYDVWTVATDQKAGTPPFNVLERYGLVIVAAGDSRAQLDMLPGGMTALQMYLLSGGRLMMSGYKWRHDPSLATYEGMQQNGAMYFLSRYFAGFELINSSVRPRGSLVPLRLFDDPLFLSTETTADAAGNGEFIALGQPLAELETIGSGTSPGIDIGLAAPLTVEEIMPYMREYIVLPDRGATMTGVTPDATLEHPLRTEAIPWRALFAGFAVEAIEPRSGHITRAQFLRRVFDWATEEAAPPLDLVGPTRGVAGEELAFAAAPSRSCAVEFARYEWDAGDGRQFVRTSQPEWTIRYDRQGEYTVRVEGMTRGGHTAIGALVVTVGEESPGATLFVPYARLERE